MKLKGVNMKFLKGLKWFSQRDDKVQSSHISATAMAVDALQTDEKFPMTDEQYLEQGGSKCPFCGSEHIDGARLHSDYNYPWCNVVCEDCEETWTDHYELTGYSQDD
jgi:hypothetical protein